MLTREVHIQMDLVFQSLNSHVRRTLEPQEKDWLFNEASISYIKERTNNKYNQKKTGFEADDKRYEDIEQLITTVSMPLYVASSPFHDTFFSYKPANLLNYIQEDGFQVKTFSGCNFNFADYTTSGGSGLWVSQIDFPVDSGTTPFYQNFKIIVDGVTLFDGSTSVFPDLNASLVTKEFKFYLISLIVDYINSQSKFTGVFAYWQKIGNGAINNALFLTSYTQKTISTTSFTGYAPQVNNFLQYPLTKYLDASLIKLTSEYAPCRVIKTSERNQLIAHSFGSTKPSNPLISLENDLILVHHKKRFISNELVLSYIRKPRKIDLLLNINPELSDDVCMEIITIAMRMLAGRTGSPNEKSIINESLLTD